MKKMMMIMAMMITMLTSAHAMSYNEAKDQALFLADKMAYELNLSDAQYEAAYEINLDYLMSVTDSRSLYGRNWTRRNASLQSVLASWQWSAYRAAEYFYRPLAWVNNNWYWRIHHRYTADRSYRPQPKAYVSYHGGTRTHAYYSGRSWNAPKQRSFGTQKRTFETSRQNYETQRRTLENNRRNLENSRRQFDQSRKELGQAQRQYEKDRKNYEKELKKEQKRNDKVNRNANNSSNHQGNRRTFGKK